MASKKAREFAPVLKYFVQVQGMYVHPSYSYIEEGRLVNYCGGATVWTHKQFEFWTFGDAADYKKLILETANVRAKDVEILKLRIHAEREVVKGPSAKDTVVPYLGDEACQQGWAENANPHPKNSWQHMLWKGQWWTKNAEMFQDWCESHLEREDSDAAD